MKSMSLKEIAMRSDKALREKLEQETNAKHLIEKFNEVKDIIPYAKMGKDEQTTLGDLVDWLRDYYGGPKDFHLAYMIMGYWKSLEDVNALMKKKSKIQK